MRRKEKKKWYIFPMIIYRSKRLKSYILHTTCFRLTFNTLTAKHHQTGQILKNHQFNNLHLNLYS